MLHDPIADRVPNRSTLHKFNLRVETNAMKRPGFIIIALILTGGGVLALVSCGESAKLPLSAGFGPQPQLPPPVVTVFPTVKIAQAVGWHADERPTPAPGLAVRAFGTRLDHPRKIYVLPNGDVLVAETNAPSKPADSPGLRGFITRRIMARAGAGMPSANRLNLAARHER
jgi:glucose/arabinose dehydrogenase